MILIKNLAFTNDIFAGKVYMGEMDDGEISSFRIISETPTHYIFSYSTNECVEVFEKAKQEIICVFEVREWWEFQR